MNCPADPGLMLAFTVFVWVCAGFVVALAFCLINDHF